MIPALDSSALAVVIGTCITLTACSDPRAPVDDPVDPVVEIESVCDDPVRAGEIEGVWALCSLDGEPLPYHVRTEGSPKVCGTTELWITASSRMVLAPSGEAEWSVQYFKKCLQDRDYDSLIWSHFLGTWELIDERLTLSVDRDIPVYMRQNHFDITGTFDGQAVVVTGDIPDIADAPISELDYKRQN